MSRAILAGLIALLGLTTGAAFATNDFLAANAEGQLAYFGGGSTQSTSGGLSGSSYNGGSSSGRDDGARDSVGANSSNNSPSKSSGNQGTQSRDGGSRDSVGANQGNNTPSGGGNTPSGSRDDGARDGVGANQGNNTPSNNGNTDPRGQQPNNPSNTSNQPTAADRAAQRTQSYANDLSNYNRDRQSTTADIKAAKDAALSRLNNTPAAPTPRAPGMAKYGISPQQGVNTYTSKMSDIVGNPTTYDKITTPAEREQNINTVTNQYNQNKAVQDAIERANRGIVDAPTYDEFSGCVANCPETPKAIPVVEVTVARVAIVAPVVKVGRVQLEDGTWVDTVAPVTGPVPPGAQLMSLDGIAQLPDGTSVPAYSPVDPDDYDVTKPLGKAVTQGLGFNETFATPGVVAPKNVTAPKTASGLSVYGVKDVDVPSPAEQKTLGKADETDPSVPEGKKTEVNRTPPGNTQQPSAKDPKESNAAAAQKAAENASKVATAKAEQSSRALGGFGNVPQGAQPAKKEQAPAKQQQPSKVATNPKTSPNGQGTGGEGGGGIGNSGRTQGTDGRGTAQQGDGQDGGTSPQGDGQGDNPNGQGGGTGNTDTPGQGDSSSQGTDTQSPNGSNGQQGGVVGGQGAGNGTGNTDSQGTDTDGQDTGEGSGDVNGEDSDGNETGSGGGGTTQPRPNLTERIAQLTQPKIGSFFSRLFQLDEPSENVEVAPPMTEEEFENGTPLEGAFTAIGQADEETESDEEEGEGSEEPGTPSEDDPRQLYRDNVAIGADDPIWDKIHPDLKRDKDRILAEGKIRTGALLAADAVYRYAEKKGVPMHVAIEGGADDHSDNHLKGGIGESLDIKPGGRDEHSGTWSKYKAGPVEYAKIATAAIQLLDGKARIGVPLNKTNGLHVQDTGNEGLNRPSLSWVYGRDTIGAGKTGKRGGFRNKLQTGEIKEEFAPRVVALYDPAIQRAPKQVALADLPNSVEEIQEVVKRQAEIEKKVDETEGNPSKVDLSCCTLPDYVSKVKLGGGGNTQTGQADVKQPENAQPGDSQPVTAQPETPQPAPKTVTRTVTEKVPSQLKKELDSIKADLRAGKTDLGTAVEAAQQAAKKAGTEAVIDQIDELRKNPNLEVVHETTMTLGEMKPHMTPEQLAQIPTIFGKQVIPNSMEFDIGIAVPKETLTAELTRTETVPADTPVQTLIGEPVVSTDEEGTEPEMPEPGLTAEEQPPVPGTTPETTWKYTTKDENGDTVANVEVQPDGSMNLEGGVLGQPVTTEPDGPQSVTIGGIDMTITFRNGKAVSIKPAPEVQGEQPESEPETAPVAPAENPVKKAVKAVTDTVKTIFNFIFGDGEGNGTNNQPGMGGTGTSTR